MRRLIGVLIFAQVIAVIKQIFEGTVWSIIFTLVLAVGTAIFYYFLSINPLIGPEKFPEEKEDLKGVIQAFWWNLYKHPLIASNVTEDKEIGKCAFNPATRESVLENMLYDKVLPEIKRDSPNLKPPRSRLTKKMTETFIGLSPKDPKQADSYQQLDERVFSFVDHPIDEAYEIKDLDRFA